MTDSSPADDDDDASVPFSTGSVRDVCTMVTRLCRAFFLLFFLPETESFFELPPDDLRGGGKRSSAVIITAVFIGVDLADEPGSATASEADGTATEDGGGLTDTTLTRSGRRLERSAAVAGCAVG